jgi:GH15 family glucan-1,4-alpha-glucosidase
MVLSLAPVFLDERFREERSPQALDLLERLTRKAMAVAGTPDAGIWEYRKAWQPQTFSSLMCWAAADRMAKVAARHLPGREAEFRSAADRIHVEIVARGWNGSLRTFVSAYDGSDLDAALLQMATLRFLPPNDPRLLSTIEVVTKGLAQGRWIMRYRADDGLGQTQVAFVICTFWLVEALAIVGRQTEAREVLEHVLEALSPLGLLSEDYETSGQRMWGNFPQAYSHVGLIHAAFAASPRWSEVL